MFDKIINRLRDPKEFRRFFLSYFLVGVVGFAIPYTHDVFIKLIPFTLILNFILLLLHHQGKPKLSLFIVSTIIFLSGIAVEIAGVQTGLVFGSYAYGDGLGFKVLGTPLLIGLNWLFLIYTSSAFVFSEKIPGFVLVVLRSLAMLAYDFILEQIAPRIDMWAWEGGNIPLQNYLGWFVISVCFHTLIELCKIRIKNPMAGFVFGLQMLFFIALYFLV